PNAHTDCYPLSLHDALPIYGGGGMMGQRGHRRQRWRGHDLNGPAASAAGAGDPFADTDLAPPPVGDLQLADLALFDYLDQFPDRSEEHTSELQSRENLVCRL